MKQKEGWITLTQNQLEQLENLIHEWYEQLTKVRNCGEYWDEENDTFHLEYTFEAFNTSPIVEAFRRAAMVRLGRFNENLGIN